MTRVTLNYVNSGGYRLKLIKIFDCLQEECEGILLLIDFTLMQQMLEKRKRPQTSFII